MHLQCPTQGHTNIFLLIFLFSFCLEVVEFEPNQLQSSGRLADKAATYLSRGSSLLTYSVNIELS